MMQYDIKYHLDLCVCVLILPHVALLGLVSHQQVSMHLINHLWSDPTQWHVHLIGRHVVIILIGRVRRKQNHTLDVIFIH